MIYNLNHIITDCIDEETIEICYKFIFQQSVYYPILGHLLLQLIDSSEFDECKVSMIMILLNMFCAFIHLKIYIKFGLLNDLKFNK